MTIGAVDNLFELAAERLLDGVVQSCTFRHMDNEKGETRWSVRVPSLDPTHPVNLRLSNMEERNALEDIIVLQPEAIGNFLRDTGELSEHQYSAQVFAGSVPLFEAGYGSHYHADFKASIEDKVNHLSTGIPSFRKRLSGDVNFLGEVELRIYLDSPPVQDIGTPNGSMHLGPVVGVVCLMAKGEEDPELDDDEQDIPWLELDSRVIDLNSENPAKLLAECLEEALEMEKRAPRLMLANKIEGLRFTFPAPFLAQVTGRLYESGSPFSLKFGMRDGKVQGVYPSSPGMPLFDEECLGVMVKVIEAECSPEKKRKARSVDEGR